MQEQCALDAMQVAQEVHNLYDNCDKRKFSNSYHGHYADGFSTRLVTKPSVIIAESYYGIPISSLHTPVGTLKVCGSGSQYAGSFGLELASLEANPKFDMVLIEEGRQHRCGYYGPWYQITRINDHVYPQIKDLSEAWATEEDIDTLRPIHAALHEQAYKQGIHTDTLGLTPRLLAGEVLETDWLIKTMLAHNKNKYIYTDYFNADANRLYVDGIINWKIWHKMVHDTHLN